MEWGGHWPIPPPSIQHQAGEVAGTERGQPRDDIGAADLPRDPAERTRIIAHPPMVLTGDRRRH